MLFELLASGIVNDCSSDEPCSLQFNQYLIWLADTHWKMDTFTVCDDDGAIIMLFGENTFLSINSCMLNRKKKNL